MIWGVSLVSSVRKLCLNSRSSLSDAAHVQHKWYVVASTKSRNTTRCGVLPSDGGISRCTIPYTHVMVTVHDTSDSYKIHARSAAHSPTMGPKTNMVCNLHYIFVFLLQ